MFEDHEALVMRESNVVILRLVGLQFESGSADIDTGNQQLLDKIERAIDIYPRCEVVVEGHTDSSGGDALNTRLSQERAESVRTFLTVNGHIPGYRISAVGYGDTRPIANNKTKAGRDRNRRIDLLIIPNERAAAYQ
jgi:outer membrane protein OmpA-like peptidoglycan-associated protein